MRMFFGMLSSIVLFSIAHAAPNENKATAQSTISVSGIREGEVFQRLMPENKSTITVSVNTPVAANYYSIATIDDYGIRQQILSEGYYSSNRLSFAYSPQSKFKKVRLSLYDNQSVERYRWESPNFNVGEVFIIAGQSNAANHGDTEYNTLEFKANNLARMVDLNNPTIWKQLEGAMPYATTWESPRNGSPWASFANDLSSKLAATYGENIPIALVNVAYAGSPLEVWDPAATRDHNGIPIVLFNRLTKATDALKRLNPNGSLHCGFRAVLWHQGESNSNRDFNIDRKTNAQEPSRKWYGNQLKYIAQSFINKTGCTQPWMIAKASWLAPHWRTDGNFNINTKFDAETEIREGQAYLANRLRLNNNEPMFIAGPDTDLLTGDDPSVGRKAYRSDGIHMNRQGLDLHGKLWAAYMAKFIKGSGPFIEEKNIVPEVNNIYNMYTTALTRTPEEIAFDTEGMRYWVQLLTLYPHLQNDIYQGFLNSHERYVRDTYQTTVGRRPTSWEVNYWVQQLNDKIITRESLASQDKVGFENTLSYNGKKVFRLYVTTLGRRLPDIMADRAGLEYWTNILNNNPSMEPQIVAAFVSSPEYRVRNAFTKAKRRQPTRSELDIYMPKANNQTSDAQLLEDIWNTASK